MLLTLLFLKKQKKTKKNINYYIILEARLTIYEKLSALFFLTRTFNQEQFERCFAWLENPNRYSKTAEVMLK